MIGRPSGLARLILIGIVALLLLICVILFAVHPYARLETAAAEILQRNAPAGTAVKTIELSFPSRIVLTDLVVPVQVNGQRQQISIEKITGTISLLSFFRGIVKAQMNGDFFGGTLWMDVRADARQATLSSVTSPIALEARARDLDLSLLCRFFQTSAVLTGVCNTDIEAEVEGHNPRSIRGQALVIGEQIDVPTLDLQDIILPESYDGVLSAKLSANDGRVVIDKFTFEGTAYDLTGTGAITLKDPLDLSSLDWSFTALFKESPTVTNEDLIARGADQVVEAFVSSGARLVFTVKGTAKKPKVRVDPASSINSMMQQINR